jgi:hypothetical protein
MDKEYLEVIYSTNELTEELARLKKKGKQHKGSICFTEDSI